MKEAFTRRGAGQVIFNAVLFPVLMSLNVVFAVLAAFNNNMPSLWVNIFVALFILAMGVLSTVLRADIQYLQGRLSVYKEAREMREREYDYKG